MISPLLSMIKQDLEHALVIKLLMLVILTAVVTLIVQMQYFNTGNRITTFTVRETILETNIDPSLNAYQRITFSHTIREWEWK